MDRIVFAIGGVAGVLMFAVLVIVMAALLLNAILKRPRDRRRFLKQAGRGAGAPLVGLANIAEGTHEKGCITKKTDAAITERFLIMKIGSDADHFAVCGAADIPFGICTDEAAAAEDLVNIQLLGGCPGATVKMVASAAISQGAMLEPAASGRVATAGTGAGTHYLIGRALDAASNAGDVIEVMPFYQKQVLP